MTPGTNLPGVIHCGRMHANQGDQHIQVTVATEEVKCLGQSLLKRSWHFYFVSGTKTGWCPSELAEASKN